jgi:hypothetical protein
MKGKLFARSDMGRMGKGWGRYCAGDIERPLAEKFHHKALQVLQYGSGLLRPHEETIDRGKHFIAEKTADAESTVKAGREIMKDRIEKCCS